MIEPIEEFAFGIDAARATSAYQAEFAEGELKGRLDVARWFISRPGAARFGEPSIGEFAAIVDITDLIKGEATIDRLLTAESWADLLAR